MTTRIHTPVAVVLAALAIGIAAAAPRTALAQLPPDRMSTLTLTAPAPDWVYVLELGFPSMMISKVHIIDGAKLKLLGQLSGGYDANAEVSPDHREIYMANTYFSRGTRGKRTDVVEIFNARTLDLEGEIEIPPKRLLVVSKRTSTGLTSDGRFMLVANMTPATSVTVVDLKARKFIEAIDTPGCVMVLPAGPRRFASMCADGSLLTVDLDDSGKLKSRKRSKPFFDPNKDPVFDQPALAGTKAYFDSYHGMIHEVDLSGEEAKPVASWSLLTQADQAAKWRPGGWQTIDEHGGLLYVLMHQGGEWTHKQFGTEVWVLKPANKARVARIKLQSHGYSIHVSRAEKPLLFNLVANPEEPPSRLETYSLPDGKYRGVYMDLGAPFLMYGP
jgi:methylamine dehydrogenase heavy chain